MTEGASSPKSFAVVPPTAYNKDYTASSMPATSRTGAGQWSARKAQLLAKEYKAKGGGYAD